MQRPVIQIQKDSTDRVIEIIGLIALFLLIGLPIYFYNQLPDIIPTHFDFNGQPDDFQSKWLIWLGPIVGLAMYILLSVINKAPHKFNYPVSLTEENVEQQYIIATKMIRVLRTIIVAMFAYLAYASIQISMNNQNDLGAWFLPLFLITLFGAIGYFLYQAKAKA